MGRLIVGRLIVGRVNGNQFKGVYPTISCDIIRNLREKKLFN